MSEIRPVIGDMTSSIPDNFALAVLDVLLSVSPLKGHPASLVIPRSRYNALREAFDLEWPGLYERGVKGTGRAET